MSATGSKMGAIGQDAGGSSSAGSALGVLIGYTYAFITLMQAGQETLH